MRGGPQPALASARVRERQIPFSPSFPRKRESRDSQDSRPKSSMNRSQRIPSPYYFFAPPRLCVKFFTVMTAARYVNTP